MKVAWFVWALLSVPSFAAAQVLVTTDGSDRAALLETEIDHEHGQVRYLVRLPAALTPPPGRQQWRALRGWHSQLFGQVVDGATGQVSELPWALVVADVRPADHDSTTVVVTANAFAPLPHLRYRTALRTPFGTVRTQRGEGAAPILPSGLNWSGCRGLQFVVLPVDGSHSYHFEGLTNRRWYLAGPIHPRSGGLAVLSFRCDGSARIRRQSGPALVLTTTSTPLRFFQTSTVQVTAEDLAAAWLNADDGGHAFASGSGNIRLEYRPVWSGSRVLQITGLTTDGRCAVHSTVVRRQPAGCDAAGGGASFVSALLVLTKRRNHQRRRQIVKK